MANALLTFIVVVIVLGVAYWALHKLWAAFGLPPLILVVIDVLLVIFGVWWVLQVFGLIGRIA
jgi:hypothetical protein